MVDVEAGVGEGTGERKGAGYVGAVAGILAAGVEEEVLPAGQGLVVVLVMEGCGVGARGDDAVVGLFAAAVSDAFCDEDSLELALVGRGSGGMKDGRVGEGGDYVGFAD